LAQSGRTSQIFVGRQRELAALTAAIDDALEDRGQIVMLAGEPGIGKTRTAQKLASYAESSGVLV
jgi:predicted ATPase|tara:strand:+ start:135 stop:329 length:195 start_codon:yes stop_codon:yes gene_type:complete